MADFTALKTAIQTYIKQNGNEEITGEILQEILLSVVTTLGDGAINDLITALGNEVTARQQADGTLQQNITNEATARGNADTALGGRIDDEATARANGDTAISNRLGSSITAENTAADQIGAEAEARAAADTALQGLIDGITDNIENGYVYAGIATPSSTPASGKVFYLALTAGTYTNFGSTVVSQGINILKYNGSAWSLDAFIGIDDIPTPNSPKLVKSGGVFDKVMTDGSAFDISAHFASGGTLATYADLSAALTALNTLSADYKRGGMSIKFVQSSDNKYVQYFLTKNEWSASPTDWDQMNLEEEVSQLGQLLNKLNIATGGYSSDKAETINIFDDITFVSGRYRNDGTFDSNNYYKHTNQLAARKGDIFTFTSTLNINTVTFWKNGQFVSGADNLYKRVFCTVDCDKIIVSFVASANVTGCTRVTATLINNATEGTFSTNLLDIEHATLGKYIKEDGTMIDGDKGSLVTDFIPVKPGDQLIVGDSNHTTRHFRFVTAYDEFKLPVSASGGQIVYVYTVPSGISYVRLSISGANVKDDTRINKLTFTNALLRYEPFDFAFLPKGTSALRQLDYDIKNNPLAKLPPYFVKTMAYRPLGKLSKPYFCLITDDGYEGVCTYSIPTIVIGKNVPMTFAIMKGSPCLESQYLPTLKSAIENNGCTIAQHGYTRFTEYNEDQLNAFFDDEKAYFDSIGLEMKGAVCPGHNINTMVSAVAGGRFGCLRTGYHGNGSDIKGIMPNQYGWFMNSDKSNVYALDCYGIATEPLADQKGHIDFAKANNMLIIGFYHEWELDNQGGTLPHTQVEAVVDYAIEQGLEFVTLDQIPSLI